MNDVKPATPKMTKAQARLFWKNLSSEQKVNFNKMFGKLVGQELELTYVGVDDNEQIQHIVLEDKNKPSASTEPFAKHFKLTDIHRYQD